MILKVGLKGEVAGNPVLLLSLGVKGPDYLLGCPHSSGYKEWEERGSQHGSSA